jgi:hypothetical protein
MQPAVRASAAVASALRPFDMFGTLSGAASLIDLTARTLNLGTATGEAIGSGGGAFEITQAAAGDVKTLSEATLAIAGAGQLATSMTTTEVVHFTNNAGAAAIQEAGQLRAGTYVTKPGEVSGMNAAQVEKALEIGAGKGANSFTFKTPNSNLTVPQNGAVTSGGAQQWQLVRPCGVDGATCVKTP